MDWGEILLTALTNSIFTAGVLAGLGFVGRSLIERWISLNLERYKAELQQAVFERQTWWERKADAYTQIIEALSDMVYYYQSTYEVDVGETKLSDKRLEEIQEHWAQAHREVMKAASIGSFLISPEAEACLRKFREGPEEKPQPHDWLQRFVLEYNSAARCLEELVACARKDLRV